MGQTTKSNIQLVGVVILLCAILDGTGMLLGSGNVLAVDLAAQETAEESAPPVAAEKGELHIESVMTATLVPADSADAARRVRVIEDKMEALDHGRGKKD